MEVLETRALPTVRFPRLLLFALCLGWVCPSTAADDEACEAQSRELVQRLRAEGLLDLDSEREQRVAGIVMDVCEQHVQEIENRWWTESANKPGNERLKRK